MAELRAFFRGRGGAVFLIAWGTALCFAVFTQHVWEDYYITYRSSRNLATGQGLVFNPGERLHTFTSPIGVLLPAIASAVTANSSDTVALWLFRVCSSVAFAAAVTLVHATIASRGAQGAAGAPTGLVQWAALPALASAAWLCFDGKSVDFSINGMETGFMLLFGALAFWAMGMVNERRWVWVGVAWAGLMWTRPDSFVYVGLLAMGGLLFGTGGAGGMRRTWARDGLRAGALCAAIYLPWFVFAWSYYGSPVPFTIGAKAMSVGERTLTGLWETSWGMLAQGTGPLSRAFLPSYFDMGGWPARLVDMLQWVGRVLAFVWLLPRVTGNTRLASFCFCGLNVYLGYFPNYPYPWYLPGAFLFAVLTFGGLAAQFECAAANCGRVGAGLLRGAYGLAAVILVGSGVWFGVKSAGQIRAQQRLVETGTRRAIGEWLRREARAGDTVFLEPLGYIGYFSGLKTFDFPGLSSREMVAARRRLGDDWAELIRDLRPTWLVLRPKEIARVGASAAQLLEQEFEVVRVFSVLEEVRALEVRGRRYVEHDAVFTVFRQKGAAK